MQTRHVPSPQRAPDASAEALLRIRHHQQQAVAELGRHAIVSDDLPALFEQAVQLAAQMLDAEYADALKALPEDRAQILAAYGWDGPAPVGVPAPADAQTAYTLAMNEPVVT